MNSQTYSEDELLKEMSEIISEQIGCEADEITRNSTFEELEFNSLTALELLVLLEERTGIFIEMDRTLKTIGDVIDIVMRSQNREQQAE